MAQGFVLADDKRCPISRSTVRRALLSYSARACPRNLSLNGRLPLLLFHKHLSSPGCAAGNGLVAFRRGCEVL
jgi:hypothetical protein